MSLETSITFSQLPFELRTQIWEAALPEPRFVPILDDNSVERLALDEETRIFDQPTRLDSHYHKPAAERFIAGGGGYVRTTSTVLVLLHVCTESRQVMQRCGCELVFGSDGFFWHKSLWVYDMVQFRVGCTSFPVFWPVLYMFSVG